MNTPQTIPTGRKLAESINSMERRNPILWQLQYYVVPPKEPREPQEFDDYDDQDEENINFPEMGNVE